MFDTKEVLFSFVGKQVTKVDKSDIIIEIERSAKYLIDFRHNDQYYLIISDKTHLCGNCEYYGAILIIRDKFTEQIKLAEQLYISGKYIVLSDRVAEQEISAFGRFGDIIHENEFKDDNKVLRHLQRRYLDKWLDEREKWNALFQDHITNKPTMKFVNGELIVD